MSRGNTRPAKRKRPYLDKETKTAIADLIRVHEQGDYLPPGLPRIAALMDRFRRLLADEDPRSALAPKAPIKYHSDEVQDMQQLYFACRLDRRLSHDEAVSEIGLQHPHLADDTLVSHVRETRKLFPRKPDLSRLLDVQRPALQELYLELRVDRGMTHDEACEHIFREHNAISTSTHMHHVAHLPLSTIGEFVEPMPALVQDYLARVTADPLALRLRAKDLWRSLQRGPSDP